MRGNDCAVRERKLPFPKGLDRYVVAELGAQLVGLACYQECRRRSISSRGIRRDFDSVDRGSLFIGLSRCGGHVGDTPGQRYNCANQTNTIRLIGCLLQLCASLP